MTTQIKIFAFICAVLAIWGGLYVWHYSKIDELDNLKKANVTRDHNDIIRQKDIIIEIGKYDTNKSTFELEHKLIDKQIMKEIRNDEVNLSRGVHTWRSK